MRISDWSSDVCSSDLVDQGGNRFRHANTILGGDCPERLVDVLGGFGLVRAGDRHEDRLHVGGEEPDEAAGGDRRQWLVRAAGRGTALLPEDERSEEHTSELQSLMRISYAVFCLKKKNIT